MCVRVDREEEEEKEEEQKEDDKEGHVMLLEEKNADFDNHPSRVQRRTCMYRRRSSMYACSCSMSS